MPSGCAFSDRAQRSDDGAGQHDGGRQRRSPRPAIGLRQPQQPADARDERPAGRRHRQPGMRDAPRGQLCQCRGVFRGVATHGDRDIVTTMLPFGADARGHPPDGGVIEEDRFGQRLQEVDREVVTPDVCELVRQDRFDLPRRQSRHRGDREQHDRPQPADDGRRGDARGIDDREAATKAEAPRRCPPPATAIARSAPDVRRQWSRRTRQQPAARRVSRSDHAAQPAT